QLLLDLSKRRAALVRHAQQAQVALRDLLGIKEWHDVRVVEAGERDLLLALRGRQLEHQRPVRQARLSRQEDPTLQPAPQLGQQREALQRFSHLGEGGGGRWLEEAVAIEQDGEL